MLLIQNTPKTEMRATHTHTRQHCIVLNKDLNQSPAPVRCTGVHVQKVHVTDTRNMHDYLDVGDVNGRGKNQKLYKNMK